MALNYMINELARSTDNDVDYTAESISVYEDVDDAIATLEQVEHDYDDCNKAFSALNRIQLTMESTIGHRGLSEDAAELLDIALSATLGDDVFHTGVHEISSRQGSLTLQSFDGSYTQEEATEMTLEGVKDAINKVGGAVTKTAGRLINATSELFGSIFKSTKAMKKTLKKQKDAVSNINKDSEAKVKVGAYAKRIHVNGSLDPKDVSKSLTNVAEFGKEMLDDYLKNTTDALNYAIKSSKRVETDKYDDDCKKVIQDMEKESGRLKSLIGKYSKGLPGGVSFVYTIAYDGYVKAGVAISNLKVVENEKGSSKFDSNQEIELGAPKDLEQMIDSVESLISLIDSRKSELNRMKEVRKESLVYIKKSSKKDGSDKISPADKAILTILLLSGVFGSFRSIVLGMSGYFGTIGGKSRKTKGDTRRITSDAMSSINAYVKYVWKIARASVKYIDAHLKAAGQKPVDVAGE